VQTKTFKIKFPDFIENELIRHFIRGYFDGDGCIYNPEKRDVHISILGNIQFITALQNHFIKILNVNEVKLHQRFKHSECYTLSYHGLNLPLKVLNYLYKDSTIYLDRKYKKYLSILEQ
jgi:intein-encoded DNA endonuclease-like protein